MYFIVSNLVDFYNAAPLNRVWLVLLFWLFWPGLMFLVGFIGESRLVPIWRHQSKAFIPGDFALGVMAVALLGLHADGPESPDWWGYSGFFVLTVALVMTFIASKAHIADANHYPLRSRNSPTKITHDIIGYWFIPTLLLCLGVPKLPSLFTTNVMAVWEHWSIFLTASAFYLACVQWGGILDAAAADPAKHIHARHPENWQPIWRK